jgi:hypothetical protein
MHCKMEWVNEPLMYLLLPEHTGSCLSLSILANYKSDQTFLHTDVMLICQFVQI